jgi:hypothetical protein
MQHMAQSGVFIPIFLFAGLIGTIVMAPIYYFTANKLDQAGQVVVTLVVALLLVGLILSAATDKAHTDTAVFRNVMTVVILTPLAAGWIISALIGLLVWAFTSKLASRAEPGSDLLTFKEDDLLSANGAEGQASSPRDAALDHEPVPVIVAPPPGRRAAQSSRSW